MIEKDGIVTSKKTEAEISHDTLRRMGNQPDAEICVRELKRDEFSAADKIWLEYHDTTGDPASDRVFAVFSSNRIVSLARCRRHTDGMDVDGIFTPAEHRKKGYSRIAVGALVEACHNDDLYMHAVRHLIDFYKKEGFITIEEKELPQTIRERYVWAGGNLEGAEVQPMYRKAGLFS